jgi:hypothetical protein
MSVMKDHGDFDVELGRVLHTLETIISKMRLINADLDRIAVSEDSDERCAVESNCRF